MPSLTFGGGLNEADDFNIQMDECIAGQNFLLNKFSKTLRPRPPQDLKGTAPNSGDIRGIMQLVKTDSTETTIIQAGNTVYEWDGTTFTSRGTVSATAKLRDTTWALDDFLVITDIEKQTVLQKWDGATLCRLKTEIGNGTVNTLTSLTRTGTTATATFTLHGYVDGQYVTIADAVETDYNGTFLISNVTANTFDYTVANSPTTPATGTITAEVDDNVYAKYSIVKDGRVWLFNVTTGGADIPHMMLASTFEDPEKLDSSERAVDGTFTTGNEAFYILTKDLKPINGVTVFQNQLIISTEDGRLYKLQGSDATDYAFVDFYSGSAATGTESMVNIGNDVLYMKSGGAIESLLSTDKFGDVEADDVSKWIPDTVAGLSDSLSVYDQQRQQVMFFVNNRVLVFDKEMFTSTELSPWSVWITKMGNEFNTNAAKFLRVPGTTNKTVYWGDDAGQIFELNGVGENGDAGTHSILMSRRTKLLVDGDQINDILHGRIEYRRVGNFNLQMDFEWSDHYSTTTCSVPLKEPVLVGALHWGGATGSYFNELVYFNGGVLAQDRVSTAGFTPAGKGESLFLTLTADTTVNFLVNRIYESERA